MTKPFIDIAGQRFGLLTAIAHVAGQVWRFSCACGNEVEAKKSAVIYESSLQKSCGCLFTYTRKVLGFKRTIDVAGQRFGNLTVLELAPLDERNASDMGARWVCRCDCGTLHTVRGNLLRSGQTTSCGCNKRTAFKKRTMQPTLPGERFGRLTAVEKLDGEFGVGALWIMGCDCGNVSITRQRDFRYGTTTSCGCAKEEARRRNAERVRGITVNSP